MTYDFFLTIDYHAFFFSETTTGRGGALPLYMLIQYETYHDVTALPFLFYPTTLTCRLQLMSAAVLSVCLRVKFPLDAQDDKNPLLTYFTTATKWVIYHAWVMQYHTHTHTGRNHNSDGDGDARDKGAVRVLQHGSRSTGGDSQERERLLEHTHTQSLPHTHIQTLRRWDMSPSIEMYSAVISLSTRYT